MKIAVLILAHKSPEQVSRLVSALTHPHLDVFIHLDKRFKAGKEDFRFQKEQKVVFLEERINCYLNTYSLVEATLMLISRAQKTDNYKYYILLSGQDYPIKKVEYIYDLLNTSYPREFFDFEQVKPGTWCQGWGEDCFNQNLRQKLFDVVGNKTYFSKKGSILRSPIKLLADQAMTKWYGKPIKNLKSLGFTYAAGSAFWILTDQAIKRIQDVGSDCNLEKVFRRTQTPEECFFQTVLADTDIPKNRKLDDVKVTYDENKITRMDRDYLLRFIFDYKDGKSSGHPFILSEKEFEMLIESNSLFARKFDLAESPLIFNKLDEYLKTGKLS